MVSPFTCVAGGTLAHARGLHVKLGSTLLTGLPGSTPVNMADQPHEGITVDNNGLIFMVSENGGGDINNPQLWVYAPAPVPKPDTGALLLGAAGTCAMADAGDCQTPRSAFGLIEDQMTK